MRRLTLLLALSCLVAPVALAAAPTPAGSRPHNVILFVPDGLRAAIVRPDTAPALAEVRDRGVNLANSHSLYPTFTTPNASALATGHYLGDTGDFGNALYTGMPIAAATGSVTPFIEDDAVLEELDEKYGGNFLNESTLLHAARLAGLSTAAVGKLGPTKIQDVSEPSSGRTTLVFDDQTGTDKGVVLPPDVLAALQAAGLPAKAPGRGENGKTNPGTQVANVEQQRWFTDVVTQVLLPRFRQADKPFFLVYWSRDPDGTQHNQGDSPGSLTPGINGPTSLAAIRNADDNLARLRQALKAQGLEDSTDILVAADHGFSTIAKESATSPAAKGSYPGTPAGQLPSGFLALDLAKALNLPLFDPDKGNAPVPAGGHPSRGNGLIGPDPAKPVLIVAANGGSDLLYLLDDATARPAAETVVTALLAQDYVSGVFADQARLGAIPGTLPIEAINLVGSAKLPRPALAVSFRSWSTGCDTPELCAVEIADTGLQQGQGMHGSFSRADTHNFQAAIGPDFKAGFIDTAPSSNADIGRTIAHLLNLKIEDKGHLVGRVLAEAMPGGVLPSVQSHRMMSRPGANGLATELRWQSVGDTHYFDAAGFKGRTVGLE